VNDALVFHLLDFNRLADSRPKSFTSRPRAKRHTVYVPAREAACLWQPMTPVTQP